MFIKQQNYFYREYIARGTIFMIVCIFACVGPWWFTTLCAIIGMATCRAYELVFIGLMLDSLYTISASISVPPFLFTATLLLFASVIWYLHTYLWIQGPRS